MKSDSKTIITLSILNILTIICAFLSLNRLAGVLFDFKLRLFIEHFLTGFYFPLFISFAAYLGFCLFNKSFNLFGKLHRMVFLIALSIGSFFIFMFEIWWQFFVSYNSDSIPQMFYLILGIASCWLYFIRMKIIHN